MKSIKQQITDKLKELDDAQAAKFFDVAENSIKKARKTKTYPFSWADRLIEGMKPTIDPSDIQRDTPQPPAPTVVPPATKEITIGDVLTRHEEAIKQLFGYANNHATPKIETLEKQIGELQAQFATLRQSVITTSAGAPQNNGGSSLVRPNVEVKGTFTERIVPVGNPLDTGIAPSREQVENQSRTLTAAGNIVGGGARVAGPAVASPPTPEGTTAPKFGLGWTEPYAPRDRRR